MNQYTEKEIKEWFDFMIKKYPHSNMEEHLKMIKYAMFEDIFESGRLENFVKNLRENKNETGNK